MQTLEEMKRLLDSGELEGTASDLIRLGCGLIIHAREMEEREQKRRTHCGGSYEAYAHGGDLWVPWVEAAKTAFEAAAALSVAASKPAEEAAE